MSITPIFGSFKKLIFKSTKERQEFIQDLIYLGIAKSLLETSLTKNIKLDEKVITFHKNKYRKQRNKIKECTDYIVSESWKVYDQLEHRDIKTLQYKTQQCSYPFISTLTNIEKSSLELVAVALLDMALRRKRKTPLRDELKLFTDYKLLYGKLGKAIEEAGVREMDSEIEVARLLIQRIDYKKLR